MISVLAEHVYSALYRAREGHILHARTIAMLRRLGYLRDGLQPRRSWLSDAGTQALLVELRRRQRPDVVAASVRMRAVWAERRNQQRNQQRQVGR